MRANKRQSRFATLLLIAIGLPGFIGIWVVRAQANANQPETVISRLQATSTSTRTPTFTQTLPTPLSLLTSTSLPDLNVTAPPIAASFTLHAFIRAPSGTVPRPYVIL